MRFVFPLRRRHRLRFCRPLSPAEAVPLVWFVWTSKTLNIVGPYWLSPSPSPFRLSEFRSRPWGFSILGLIVPCKHDATGLPCPFTPLQSISAAVSRCSSPLLSIRLCRQDARGHLVVVALSERLQWERLRHLPWGSVPFGEVSSGDRTAPAYLPNAFRPQGFSPSRRFYPT
jgi:hypothetical protein